MNRLPRRMGTMFAAGAPVPCAGGGGSYTAPAAAGAAGLAAA
jgi:hypothetical protein